VDFRLVQVGCLCLDLVAVRAVGPVAAARTVCHPDTSTQGIVPAVGPALAVVSALAPDPDLVRVESILEDRSGWVLAPDRIGRFVRETGQFRVLT
jgi:hypothetical protein